MIKVAKLVTGETICGEFDIKNWKKWKGVFIISLSQGELKQLLINFAPLATFGDFDQYIELKEDKFVYSYIASPQFTKLYEEQVIKLRVQQSGIILSNSSNTGPSKNNKVMPIRGT